MKEKEKELERIFKAVANRRRLAILRFLKNNDEAPVGDIAAAIRLSFTSTSKHLRMLSGVDMLDKDQRGLEVYYRIPKDTQGPIAQLLRLI